MRAARCLVFLVLTTLLCCVVMSSDASSSRPRTTGTQSRGTTGSAKIIETGEISRGGGVGGEIGEDFGGGRARDGDGERGKAAMPRDDDDGVDGRSSSS